MQCIYVVLEKCFYRGEYTFAKLRQRHRRRTLNLAKSTPKNIFESRFFVFFVHRAPILSMKNTYGVTLFFQSLGVLPVMDLKMR